MKNAGPKRRGAPPAPSWNTGAVETEWTPRQLAEMPLPGETGLDTIRRLARHTRETEATGGRGRQGDHRFTHIDRARGRKRNAGPRVPGDGTGRGGRHTKEPK